MKQIKNPTSDEVGFFAYLWYNEQKDYKGGGA